MDESLKLSELERLRIIYDEIICGSSFSESDGYYVKHLNESENIDILRKKRGYFAYYLKEGLPSEEDKLKEILADERWTKAEEERIAELRLFISDNEKNLVNIIPVQRPSIEKIIKDSKEELKKLAMRRQDMIGATADEYSERESYNYLIYLSFYKDKELTERVFKSFDEIDDMEYEELTPFIKSLETCLGELKEETVKKIAALPFFINVFSYSKENVSSFLMKPLYRLTAFQTLLISLGTRNLNILSQAESDPPELTGSTKISELVDWYDLQYSIILGKRKTGSQNQGVTKSIREVKK